MRDTSSIDEAPVSPVSRTGQGVVSLGDFGDPCLDQVQSVRPLSETYSRVHLYRLGYVGDPEEFDLTEPDVFWPPERRTSGRPFVLMWLPLIVDGRCGSGSGVREVADPTDGPLAGLESADLHDASYENSKV